ncbi:ankyrin repeat domain-containing protein 50-like [Haliotis asinina]|uniref:ankyrin repeat domain-containing protein 50-like n=1 Tax=Haliotis asinina TaxID=109174 RepID=UPI00353252AB
MNEEVIDVTVSEQYVKSTDGNQNCIGSSNSTDSHESSSSLTLHGACRVGDLERVGHILSLSVVDVNSRDEEKGRTPLMVAAWKGHERIFDLLVRKGANASLVDNKSRNILHWACTGGHPDMVEHVLTRYSMYINSRTNIGVTPLMKAAYHGHTDVFDYLVSIGANVSLVDNDGDNLLHFASMGGHANMVEHILSQDLVNINSKGKHGRTPLMRAAYYGNTKMLDLLVRKGSRISSVDDTGENILHLASMGGHLEMVKYILSHNMADINAKDNDGDTAAMLAKLYGHRAVYDFLQNV